MSAYFRNGLKILDFQDLTKKRAIYEHGSRQNAVQFAILRRAAGTCQLYFSVVFRIKNAQLRATRSFSLNNELA